MELINYRCDSPQALETFVRERLEGTGRTVLIQLFSGIMQPERLKPVLELLQRLLPGAALIGATTAGEIMDGVMDSESIVISFSLFDATDVRTFYFPRSDYEHGVLAAGKTGERTKACIVFSEGLKSDSESFLGGFGSQRNDIVVAGGNAGDDLSFTRTFVMKDAEIYDEGVVVAMLDSDVLQVHNAYSLYWTPVGKEMTVTRAENNVIYEIDGQPVRERYTHYLGAETVERVPASAIEFPLIKVDDGVSIARSIIAQTDDGGFVYAGHFKNGDRVRFAIGNVEEILNHASEIQERVASYPAEATFIYSCSVRKLFLQEQLNYEFGLLQAVAPTAGFFTYGEFYHSPSANQLLNITTTTLSLSESEALVPKREWARDHEYQHTMLKSLTHLVNVTQNELDENIAFLDQYKMVLDESSIVSKTDARGVITYVNDAFCEVSGYSREELLGNNHNIVRHPDTPSKIFEDLWRTIRSGKVWKETFKNLAKNGQTYYVKSVIAPIFDDEGHIVEYIAARMDVTDIFVKEQIIKRQRSDAVTGLKNRTALFGDLDCGERELTLVLFNIDRFSDINDYFGYDIGDMVLKAFADKLLDVSPHDKVYRISGDEFAVLCMERPYDDACRRDIVAAVNMMQNSKFRIRGYDISVNVTCGVANARCTDIYKSAHIALKSAKEEGAELIFFNDNEALEEKTRNNVIMIDTIKAAIDDDRIVPYFQGIVDNRSRKIVKYESLIRLIDADGKVLSPFWFLEHAKKSKLYDTLTRIMIAKTFERFETLEYEFSLNMTLQDILSAETQAFLFETLERSSASNRLVFEIVESEGIENFDEVIRFIQKVRQYGCKVAIDDFGTGYSNFSYLSRLDVDYIKIDGSLIKNINDDPDHLITVESILHFANKKGIKTVAEFVENEAIYDKLVELGIDFSQGYFFSAPGPDIVS